jgi:hypothetical protein
MANNANMEFKIVNPNCENVIVSNLTSFQFL